MLIFNKMNDSLLSKSMLKLYNNLKKKRKRKMQKEEFVVIENENGGIDYYLDDVAIYKEVTPLIEEQDNHYFAYGGFVATAGDTLGVIETNEPLSEILKKIDGRKKLIEILKNAKEKRNEYYNQIGESVLFLEAQVDSYSLPSFPLGNLHIDKKNKITISDKVSKELMLSLKKEYFEEKRKLLLRDEIYIKSQRETGIIMATQECWIEQNLRVSFHGINMEALEYEYVPEKMLITMDNLFVYIGSLTIGQGKLITAIDSNITEMISPYYYENIVVWTERKQLMEYFLEEQYAGLSLALGNIFWQNMIDKTEPKEFSERYIGGLKITQEGVVDKTNIVPESIIMAAQEYLKNKNKRCRVIDVSSKRR